MSAALKALILAKSIEVEFQGKALPKTALEKQGLQSRVLSVSNEAFSSFNNAKIKIVLRLAQKLIENSLGV